MAGSDPTDATAEVAAFLDAVAHPTRRADARALDVLFRDITGWQPRLWNGSILGYGSYHYRYDSGREGDFLATGFSPRKANLSLYIMPGYQDHGAILNRLGKHKTGAACVYVNKLADIDMAALQDLIRAGLVDLARTFPLTPT
jgi:hypothetical protein